MRITTKKKKKKSIDNMKFTSDSFRAIVSVHQHYSQREQPKIKTAIGSRESRSVEHIVSRMNWTMSIASQWFMCHMWLKLLHNCMIHLKLTCVCECMCEEVFYSGEYFMHRRNWSSGSLRVLWMNCIGISSKAKKKI